MKAKPYYLKRRTMKRYATGFRLKARSFKQPLGFSPKSHVPTLVEARKAYALAKRRYRKLDFKLLKCDYKEYSTWERGRPLFLIGLGAPGCHRILARHPFFLPVELEERSLALRGLSSLELLRKGGFPGGFKAFDFSLEFSMEKVQQIEMGLLLFKALTAVALDHPKGTLFFKVFKKERFVKSLVLELSSNSPLFSYFKSCFTDNKLREAFVARIVSLILAGALKKNPRLGNNLRGK